MGNRNGCKSFTIRIAGLLGRIKRLSHYLAEKAVQFFNLKAMEQTSTSIGVSGNNQIMQFITFFVFVRNDASIYLIVLHSVQCLLLGT